MEIVLLQLKIKDFYGKLHTFTKIDGVMFIHNDDKEFF